MAILIKQRLKFSGGDADNHKVDAYAAAQSLEGIVWALTIITHYGVSGKLRQRGDLSSSVRIFITPPKRGSVFYGLEVWIQENAFLAGMVGGYAVNTVTPFINGLVSYVLNASLTGIRQIPHGAKKYIGRLKDDEVDDLIARVEPPLTRAHAAIGKSVDLLQLTYRTKDLATLDLDSKRYLEARAREDFQTIDTNITSFNVLTGNGRLYHPDEKQTVPFSLSPQAMLGTPQVLTLSMSQYASGNRGVIRLTAQRVQNIDGRLKQLIVSAASEVPQSDWDAGQNPLRTPQNKP
ncbi:hypothetical protein [Vannielia litorea]|uniref:Uncharacterized protein n=1 Tax=Vannielia litorea TaxID=1217970 RepID=A0A1N6IAG9_9RHOB|nr:hypothetical protein [Vannielia litorea]SIO29038.1 hypothetical protein SAMN05444002_3627 [Vannielia litorea]